MALMVLLRRGVAYLECVEFREGNERCDRKCGREEVAWNYFVFEATADEINVTTEPSFNENVSQARRNVRTLTGGFVHMTHNFSPIGVVKWETCCTYFLIILRGSIISCDCLHPPLGILILLHAPSFLKFLPCLTCSKCSSTIVGK